MFSKLLFKESAVILVIVAVLHWVATKFYLYWTVYEFDSLMHFLGGVWVSLIILWFFFFSGLFNPSARSGFRFFLTSFLGIIVVGIFWEVFELLGGITSTLSPEYVGDTSLDLVMDTLGALAACMYGYMKELGVDHNRQLQI